MELKAHMKDWPSLRPVILHVYESEVPMAGRNVRSRTTGNYFVWLILRGEVQVENDGRMILGKQDDWVIPHPGPHSQVFSPGAQILSIQFQAHWPDGYPLFTDGLSLAFPSKEAPELEIAARDLLKAARPVLPNDPFQIRETALSLKEYFTLQNKGMTFLLHLFEELENRGLRPSRIGQIDERLVTVLRKLDQWPLDLPLDIQHIANPLGLTANHLSRLFQSHFKISPTVYYNHRRQNHARQLLAQTSVPIKHISIDLGFHSIADFSAWFKRCHGCPPSAYRLKNTQ